MPVLIEHLTSLAPKDRIDIEKIRKDAPEWLPTDKSIDEWLSQPNQKLFGGRFNDHLLVAALVTEKDTTWDLAWLCVRKVTRHRCVGQRIISELERLAKESGRTLHVTLPSGAGLETLPSYLKKMIS